MGRSATDVAGAVAGSAFAALARVRSAKALHPAGATHAAALVVAGDGSVRPVGTLLSRPGRHPALVRFSRAIGLPRPLPDLLGMAVRLPDCYGPGRHQDVLLTSSIDRPVLHHLFLPAGDVQQRPYSSSLPYRGGGRRFLIGALPDPSSPRPDGDDELDRLARAAATGALRFTLAIAPLGGRFRAVGTLHVGERLGPEAERLRFNPWNTGGGLEPVGWINRLRRGAYPASQAAWNGGGRARELGG